MQIVLLTETLRENKMNRLLKRTWCYAFLVLLTAYNTTLAQNNNITGRIVDNDDEPLIGANVRLVDSKGKLLTGSTTDTNGKFAFRTDAKGEHKLVVSYVGYKTLEKKLHLPLNKSLGKLVIHPNSELLNSVVVRAKAADVQIKGDTLVFNASAYNPSETSTLEDLIKRLPGAEVDETGKITINGRIIDKLLVDGKEFFVGDASVATKNLPANAIEKLEMLDRENDQSKLTGFSDGQEETVLNLSFKEEYKNGLFGNALAGYGTKNRFEVNGVLNNFTGSNRQTFVAGTNNTNNRGASEFDAQNNNRRRGRPNEGVTTSVNVAADVTQNLGKTDLQSNGGYGYTNQFIEKLENKQLLNTDGNLITTSKGTEKNIGHNANISARIEIKPNKQNDIVIRPTLNWSKEHGNFVNNSVTKNAQTTLLNQANTVSTGNNASLRVGATGDYAHQLGGKQGRILSFRLRTFYTQGQTEDVTQNDLLLTNDNQQQVSLYKLLNNNRNIETMLRTSWVEPLGNNFFLQGVARWSYSQRNTNHNFYQGNTEGIFTIANDQFSGNFTNKLNTFQTAVNVQKREKKYDITLGVSFNPTFMNTLSPWLPEGSYKTTNYFFAPSLRLNYNPAKQTSFRLSYYGWSDMPSVNFMLPFSDPSNPLEIKEGNLELKPSFTHSMRGFIRHYNSKSKIAFNMFFRFSYIQNSVTQRQSIDSNSGIRHITYENVNGNANIGAFWNLSMPIFSNFFSLNVGAASMYFRNIGFIKNDKNLSHNVRLMPRLALSYVKGDLYLRLNGMGSYNYTHNSIASSNNTNVWDYKVGFDGNYSLPFGLTLESDVSYQSNIGYNNAFKKNEWLWNAAIAYNFLEGKRATIRIKLYDILGNETGITHASNAFSISESSVNVLGQYLMVHFVYRFGDFSAKGEQTNRISSPHRRRF